MDELSHLLEQINYNNKKFWIDNDPQISDIDYDKLVRNYIALGGDLSKIEKIAIKPNIFYHPKPLKGLLVSRL